MNTRSLIVAAEPLWICYVQKDPFLQEATASEPLSLEVRHSSTGSRNVSTPPTPSHVPSPAVKHIAQSTAIL
jgi:ABC-type uncharacterized transport system involved in gliding motility auxiliary subunit